MRHGHRFCYPKMKSCRYQSQVAPRDRQIHCEVDLDLVLPLWTNFTSCAARSSLKILKEGCTFKQGRTDIMAHFGLPALNVSELIAGRLLLPTKNVSKPKAVVLGGIFDKLLVEHKT